MPLAVVSTGGNYAYPDHAHETFDTMNTSWQMKDYAINWSHTAGIGQGPYDKGYGLAYIGNDATLVINREGWELYPEVNNGAFKVPALPDHGGSSYHEDHVNNFLDCIKSREDPNCPVENGRLVASYAHMGNISLRTGSRLEWNENSRNFGKNAPANVYIRPVYRKPWKFPDISL